MPLPQAHNVRIDKSKLVEYLLAAEHPENGGKAGFFAVLGYHSDTWRELAGEFRRLAREGSIIKEIQTIHGRKYIQDGFIHPHATLKRGTEYGIRMVWIMEHDAEAPRLVTAYPGEGTIA